MAKNTKSTTHRGRYQTKSRPPKVRKMPSEPVLTQRLSDRLLSFIEYHPATRFSKALRSMLFEFLTKDDVAGSLYFEDLMYGLEALFELLDVIEKEYPQFANSEDDDD